MLRASQLDYLLLSTCQRLSAPLPLACRMTSKRATRWEDEMGFSHDVMVVYPDSLKATAADVVNIAIPGNAADPVTGQPTMIRLSQVAGIEPSVAPQQINRRSLERQVSVSAGVLPGFDMASVASAVRAGIDSIGLPLGYHVVFGGDVRSLEETKGVRPRRSWSGRRVHLSDFGSCNVDFARGCCGGSEGYAANVARKTYPARQRGTASSVRLPGTRTDRSVWRVSGRHPLSHGSG